MIKRLSHVTLYVEDSAAARRFYVDVLGFKPVIDKDLGGWRWVTVAPPDQPDLQIVLLTIDHHPNLDAAARATVRAALRAGLMPIATLRTGDCQATHDELVARGVKFLYPPKAQFFGLETTFRDPDGNLFSLVGPPHTA
jgi:catechol 2,3-dioxygenase-like lactoylglutathione lyase family enzyme